MALLREPVGGRRTGRTRPHDERVVSARVSMPASSRTKRPIGPHPSRAREATQCGPSADQLVSDVSLRHLAW